MVSTLSAGGVRRSGDGVATFHSQNFSLMPCGSADFMTVTGLQHEETLTGDLPPQRLKKLGLCLYTKVDLQNGKWNTFWLCQMYV